LLIGAIGLTSTDGIDLSEMSIVKLLSGDEEVVEVKLMAASRKLRRCTKLKKNNHLAKSLSSPTLYMGYNTTARIAMHQAFLHSIGERYGDFTLMRFSKIEELDCHFKEILHEPTGAHIIHIENSDPENLFCLSFQTLPDSSNGAPHILEHTVLCGSKKFPVKDPFFSMTRRSLNTFMNALTGADFTCYPAASQIEKDFYNLLDVYLDAVFHPELKKTSFLQEGCRLEFEKANDPLSPLKFKGIVYNEMKGSLSSGESRMWHAVLQELFPDLPYAYNSGGEPKEIPFLSYEGLLSFYETYYHPSRCLFFFYGNLPLKNHLDFIEERALKNVAALPPLPPFAKQTRRKSSQEKKLYYPVTAEESTEEKVMVSFGWLTCQVTDQEEVLALSLIDSILTDTDASPLKLALLESGLCSQADAFIDIEMSEVPYVITCKGCKESDIDALETILLNTLSSLSKTPFPPEWIDASLHQLELSRMEIGGDHAPFGLTLFFRAGLAKQHGCDPEKNLEVHKLFEIMLAKVKDPLYLPGLIHKHFVQNTHRVKVLMIPDPALGSKENEEEATRLEEIKKALSEQEAKELILQAQNLETIQKKIEEQDLSCLPKVTLQDVPLLSRDFPLKKHTFSPLTIFHHDCFTNHIFYADLLFDIPKVHDEEISYLQLLLSLIPELGAGKRNYRENLEFLQAHTGGVHISSNLHVQISNNKELKPSICIRGKALERKRDKLFPIMQDMLVFPDLKDKKRIKDLLRQIHSSLQNRISKNALRYAAQLALSGYGPASHINQASSGIRYYHFIQDLMTNLDSKLPFIQEKLIALYEKFFSFHNPHLVLSCNQALYEKIQKECLSELALPTRDFIPWDSSFPLEVVSSQGKIISSQVAYNIQAYPSISYIHPHAPALALASQLFDNKILHTQIREIGGAYGAGASFNPEIGSFYFHSHRDPHIASTFMAFDQAIEMIAGGDFSEQDLEEAKLGIMQHLDMPISPGSRAILAYSWMRNGKERSLRQHYRNSLLQIDKEQIQRAVQVELVQKKQLAIQVSFSGHDLLKKENQVLKEQGRELAISHI
jgi:presequence protease